MIIIKQLRAIFVLIFNLIFKLKMFFNNFFHKKKYGTNKIFYVPILFVTNEEKRRIGKIYNSSYKKTIFKYNFSEDLVHEDRVKWMRKFKYIDNFVFLVNFKKETFVLDEKMNLIDKISESIFFEKIKFFLREKQKPLCLVANRRKGFLLDKKTGFYCDKVILDLVPLSGSNSNHFIALEIKAHSDDCYRLFDIRQVKFGDEIGEYKKNTCFYVRSHFMVYESILLAECMSTKGWISYHLYFLDKADVLHAEHFHKINSKSVYVDSVFGPMAHYNPKKIFQNKKYILFRKNYGTNEYVTISSYDILSLEEGKILYESVKPFRCLKKILENDGFHLKVFSNMMMLWRSIFLSVGYSD